MQKKKLFAAVMLGLMAVSVMAGCGDEKKPAAPKPAVKLNLPWEKFKLVGGKEMEFAKLNNANKIVIAKTFNNAGAMTKIGDTIYIRVAPTKTIARAKLEGTDLKITNPTFAKDCDENAFLGNDGTRIYYGSKFKVVSMDAAGKQDIAYKRFIKGIVGIPGKAEGLTFLNANPIKAVELQNGVAGKELGTIIPDKNGRKVIATPSGLACDGTNAYLHGSTLDGKMSVGAVAVYGLDGKQKYILGNKDDKSRAPGFLASASELAVTKDYIWVMDVNIRQLNIFNNKDGKIVDIAKADKLFSGYRGVNLLPYSDNNVLAIVKSNKKDEADKIFMLNL